MSGRLLTEIRERVAPLSRGLYLAAKRLAMSAPRGLAIGEWWREDRAKWSGPMKLDGKDRPALSDRQARANLAELVARGIVERDGCAVRFVTDHLAAVERRQTGGFAADNRRKRGGFVPVSDWEVIENDDKIREGEKPPLVAAFPLLFEGEAQAVKRLPFDSDAILAEFGFKAMSSASGAVAEPSQGRA